VLYIGGTGQISLPCVEASLAAGHDVTVLNRNETAVPMPKGVKTLVGDMNDVAYGELGDSRFDVVAQFRAYTPAHMKRDVATFTGKTGQYVFISSASVYEKPVRHYMMTERTKIENKFWQYRRDKIACERLLRDQNKLAYTIVRPSHTVRTHMPIQVGDPDAAIRRMIAGKPVIVAGDGSSLWTLTRAVDVATPLVRLLGNSAALNDDFHITTDRGFTWRQIHEAIAHGFGVEAIHAPVPSETLVRCSKEWGARCSATSRGRLSSTTRR
jgi:nucleoside-diphosphate-sugar epimerase